MKLIDKLRRYPLFALAFVGFVGFAVWSLIGGKYGFAFVEALFAAYSFVYWRATKTLTAENERLRKALDAHHSASPN